MRKLSILLTLSLLVALVATSAFATTSRQAALAGSGDYFNDDANIFRWNGTLPSYNNMVMVEAGQAMSGGFGDLSVNYQALGFTSSFGKNWGTFGIFLLQNSTEDLSFFLFNRMMTPGFTGAVDAQLAIPTTKYSLFWGMERERLSWGVNLNRSDVRVELPGLDKADYSFTQISGGVRVDVNDDNYLDANIAFGFAGGDTLGGWDNSNAFNLAARWFWEANDNMTVVPTFDWTSWDYALKNPAEPTGEKGNMFMVGAALNMDVNSNNMLIFGAEFENFKAEYSKSGQDQTEVKYMTLPMFRVALESDITSWLTSRVGAYKMMTKVTLKDDTGEEVIFTGPNTDYNYSDFQFFLGAGFHLGEWDVDAVINPETPFRLGYWLTGYGVNDPDPPVGRISGTYRF